MTKERDDIKTVGLSAEDVAKLRTESKRDLHHSLGIHVAEALAKLDELEPGEEQMEDAPKVVIDVPVQDSVPVKQELIETKPTRMLRASDSPVTRKTAPCVEVTHVEMLERLGDAKTSDYCVRCGESPNSGSHGPFADAHDYVDPRLPMSGKERLRLRDEYKAELALRDTALASTVIAGPSTDDRKVPRMWNEQTEGPGVVSTEYDIQKAIEMVVAMTRNLLSLPIETEVDVHVKPQNHQYVVMVEVAGFSLRRSHKRMSVALEDLLSDLSTRVHSRLQEAQELLAARTRRED